MKIRKCRFLVNYWKIFKEILKLQMAHKVGFLEQFLELREKFMINELMKTVRMLKKLQIKSHWMSILNNIFEASLRSARRGFFEEYSLGPINMDRFLSLLKSTKHRFFNELFKSLYGNVILICTKSVIWNGS